VTATLWRTDSLSCRSAEPAQVHPTATVKRKSDAKQSPSPRLAEQDGNSENMNGSNTLSPIHASLARLRMRSTPGSPASDSGGGGSVIAADDLDGSPSARFYSNSNLVRIILPAAVALLRGGEGGRELPFEVLYAPPLTHPSLNSAILKALHYSTTLFHNFPPPLVKTALHTKPAHTSSTPHLIMTWYVHCCV